MKIFLYVPLILCLVGCSKDSKTSDKGGAAKDQKVKTEPIPDFPDPMTKEFIMAMWQAPHNVEGIIPEMEKIRVKEGVWKVEKEGGPNKDEMKKISSKESMSIKFVNRRFLVGKTRRAVWGKGESLENDSFVRGDDLIYYWIYTYDYNKKIYRRWSLKPDIGEGFIGESSGQIIEDNLITENVNSPVGVPDGWKTKNSRKIIKDIKDKFSSQLEIFVGGELEYYFEFSNKWVSELPKEGDFESNIAGKAISIEVKEGTKKNRMLFDFGEDRVLRLYEDGELVDESMSYRVDGLEVKFLAREQEDAQALDRLAMRMLFSSEDPKLGDEIIMKDRNNSFAGKILKIDELAKVLKESIIEKLVSYGRLKETLDGKYLYNGKPFTGKVHGDTGGGNRFEGNIVKGKWEGIWTERDKDGNKIQEDLYKNGELVSSDKLEGKSKDNSLRHNLVGKHIIFEKDKEKIEVGFLKNGEMLSGLNDDLDSGEMTYSIKNNEVIVYQDSRRDSGLIFPSVNPKIGDQIKLGPEDNNEEVTIKEISSISLVEVTELSQTGEKARVKSDLGTIQTALLNYKISAGSYPTTEQGLSALLTKPVDVRAWEGPYFKGGTINDPWNQEYGYRFPGQNQGTPSEPDIFSKGPDGLENTEDDIGNWEAEEDNPKVVVEEVKIKRPKLTPKQISDHLEFWTGKWKGYDKVTNQIFDSFEAKWKEKGVSLEFKGITFEAGEQKDTYTGSIYYDKDLGVFVDTGTYEKSGQTLVRHAILDPESGESNGFHVKPKPPEGMEVKFKWKKIDRNTVDYIFEVVQGGDTLEEKEFVIKRQGVEPKEDSNQTKTTEFPDLIEEVDTEKIITLSVDGNEVTATRIIEGFPKFNFFYITSSGAFSIDELRIGKTYDSVTQESVPDDDENIIFHDSFEYSDGEKLIDQDSWYSKGLPQHISNSPDTYTISKGSLVSDGIKSVGNRVSTEATDVISGIGIELPDAVSFDPDDNVFISFLIRPEGILGDGVWGGYFSFGAKPFGGKGILFGKPGDSSAPDDKKFAIDKQGGPIIRASGVETKVGKTSHVIVRLESKNLNETAEDEGEENNALKKNIAGKLIGFKPNEGRLQFNDDGVMMFGFGADPKDVGLTYKVKGNEVLVFQRGKRNGGILFPSLNPNVGDEIEFGPDANKRKVTITKIELADEVGDDPESLQTEKKLKDFPDDFRELTPEEVTEYFEILIGKWESVDTSSNKISERMEGKWKEKGKSIQFNGIGYRDGKPFRNYSDIVYYDKDLRVFIQKLTYKKSGTTYTRHWIWDPEKREAYGIAVDPKPPVEIEVKYQYTQKSANSGEFIFEVIKDGESIERKESLSKRKEFILEKVDIEDVPLKIEKKPKLSLKQLAEQMSENLKSKIGNLKSLRDVADKAKKAKAMNEVILLNNAIKMYELDYGKLPFKGGEKIQAKDLALNTLSGNLLSVLSGHDADDLNPRKRSFYQGKEAKAMDSEKPKGGVFGTADRLQLADPWGNPYFIVFDANYDGILKGLPGSEGKNVARNVVIWSTGGADDQKKFDPEKWIKSW
ncbi:MAG: type II secretion system protein GspG [Verrucomicrobiales bacterium]